MYIRCIKENPYGFKVGKVYNLNQRHQPQNGILFIGDKKKTIQIKTGEFGALFEIVKQSKESRFPKLAKEGQGFGIDISHMSEEEQESVRWAIVGGYHPDPRTIDDWERKGYI